MTEVAELFVTVRSEISQDSRVVIAEEQDIVYRESARVPAGPAQDRSPQESPATDSVPGRRADADAQEWPVAVDPVLLFRFSALTYNSHRIHYDRDYARQVEGYPGLVVHGPLPALLMAELARQVASLPASCEYSYRLVAPLFEGQGLIVSATAGAAMTHVTTRDSAGRQTASGAIGPARSR